MAAPAPQTDTLEARLQTVGDVPGNWLKSARDLAANRLRAMGLPGRRDEYWRYTDPSSLASATAASQAIETAETDMFAGVDAVSLTFVDGVFRADLSDKLALEACEIERLEDAAKADIHWASDLYGSLEADAQANVDRPLAALNTATATDGVLIRVIGTAPKPVALRYLRADGSADITLHSVVSVAPGASITLLESGTGGARINTALEVDVAEGGAFHLVRAQGSDDARIAATHTFARVAKDAAFKTFTLTINGVLTRNETIVDILGDDATVHVTGAASGSEDFHHDDTVFITHDAVNCESRQVFKKVLKNGATGVFQGKILVKADAQKTDGYQISQGLLLDDDAQFLAKPELEIYADDVACSHGSTCGAVDETALFYLRSRGVPPKEATVMLVIAFLAEALDEIEDEALRDVLAGNLESWLAAVS